MGVTTAGASRAHLPQLDAWRGVAILGVLLYHINERVFSLGWVGVNLFFVLSGFLITGILLDSRGGERYFFNFYARRTLRIFPIYYLSVLAITILALLCDWDVSDVGYYLYYAQNNVMSLRLWEIGFPTMFRHSWSLAVEEQFYLVWPLLVYACGPRLLGLIAGVLFLAALGLRWWLPVALEDPYVLFITLPTQMDALAAGALCALAVRTWSHDRLRRAAVPVLLVSFAALAVLTVASQGMHSWWNATLLEAWAASRFNAAAMTLMAVMFASLIVVSLGECRGPLAFLHSRALQRVGQVSYGLYLYHFPAIYLARAVVYKLQPAWVEHWLLNLVACLLAFAAALLSWNLIERPLLGLKRHFQ